MEEHGCGISVATTVYCKDSSKPYLSYVEAKITTQSLLRKVRKVNQCCKVYHCHQNHCGCTVIPVQLKCALYGSVKVTCSPYGCAGWVICYQKLTLAFIWRTRLQSCKMMIVWSLECQHQHRCHSTIYDTSYQILFLSRLNTSAYDLKNIGNFFSLECRSST